MLEGYVTFVDDTPNYYELTKILVESVLEFSTRPIEVFSINTDFNYSNNRVINKRIDLEEKNYATICYSKLYATLNSSFDYGIQLDSDFIITRQMDNLFDIAKTVDETPLGSLHPSDPNNLYDLMSLLGVKKRTQPYVHATYLFSKKCNLFFEECYNLSQELGRCGNHPPNFDETILNVMLCKYNSNRWVDCYDPYFDFFINRETKNMHGYGWMETVNFYSCHGIKDPSFAKTTLEYIRNNNL